MEVIDLHFLHIGDLQYNIHLFKLGFESRTMKNSENDTPLDYIAPHIKIVKMEVTLTSTFLA